MEKQILKALERFFDRGTVCQKDKPTFLVEFADSETPTQTDLAKYEQLLAALIVLSPVRAMAASDIASGVKLYDASFGHQLSLAKGVKTRSGWALGEALGFVTATLERSFFARRPIVSKLGLQPMGWGRQRKPHRKKENGHETD